MYGSDHFLINYTIKIKKYIYHKKSNSPPSKLDERDTKMKLDFLYNTFHQL